MFSLSDALPMQSCPSKVWIPSGVWNKPFEMYNYTMTVFEAVCISVFYSVSILRVFVCLGLCLCSLIEQLDQQLRFLMCRVGVR